MAPSRTAVGFLLFMLLSALPSTALAQRKPLSEGEGLYPRVVRISHDPTSSLNGRIVASVTSFPGGKGEEQIFASNDDGVSFSRVGTINDPDFASGLCCGTLYELPVAVGDLRAGTLLWAGSVGGDTPGKPMQIKIFQSADRGATWRYLSNCATAAVPRSGGGLWEPEFTIAANGALVCFYSDETIPNFSQLIHQVTSRDGVNWTAPVRTIASGAQADRPGMVVVRKLPSGRYFMSFELCGPAACTAFSKTSADGIDWTPASNVGSRIETADGHWFLHTPTNAWASTPGTANGRLFVIGQILSSANGVASGNGRTMFYNDTADASGPWKEMAAPVSILSPPDASNFCQNYSSPLLPSADGASILGMASDFDSSSGTRVCRTFFASVSATLAARLGLTAGNVSIGAGKSGDSTVVVTPTGGYSGTMKLSVSIPGFNGTAKFANDTLVSNDGAPQTTTLTLSAAQTAFAGGLPMLAGFGLGGLMLFAIAPRRRSTLMIGTAALLAGCGGGSSNGGGSSIGTTPLPTPQSYTATITVTDVASPSITTTTNITVTVG